jgi:uncharacterized membrane protein YbaN (DUF454 family)
VAASAGSAVNAGWTREGDHPEEPSLDQWQEMLTAARVHGKVIRAKQRRGGYQAEKIGQAVHVTEVLMAEADRDLAAARDHAAAVCPPPADPEVRRQERRREMVGTWDSRGGVPTRVKWACILGAFLLLLLTFEVRSFTACTVIVTAVLLAVTPKLLRQAANSYNDQHDVEQRVTRIKIQRGRETAIREGLWWPEADGSISIGGVRVDKMYFTEES